MTTEIYLTESELRQIVKIVNDIKKTEVFTFDPMPEGEMSEDTERELRLDRGIISIISRDAETRFVIDARDDPKNREIGYFLNVGTDSL